MRLQPSKRNFVLGGVVLTILWVLLDVWIIQGKVLDAATLQPIPNATVLVSIYARGIDPPYPHAWVASSQCLRTIVLETDKNGRYRTIQLTTHPWLINSSVVTSVLKEGFYQERVDRATGRRGVLGGFSARTLYLQSENDKRWSFPARRNENAEDFELTLSRRFSSIVSIGSGAHVCSEDAWSIVKHVLVYGMSNAKTAAETEFVRLRCKDAHNLMVLREVDWRWMKTSNDEVLTKFPECRPLFQDH